MDDTSRTRRWHFAMALLVILLAAGALRLYRLPNLPLGFHYDEAANGILAGEIARGIKIPIFISSYTGKEALFFYWTALWMKLLGVSPFTLRLSAALAGLATVGATVWAAHELLHDQRDAPWVALLSGAFLAASFWHLVLSRCGFRAVTQPLMQALTVAALWRGLRLRPRPSPSPCPVPPASKGEREEFELAAGRMLWLLLAGLFCGLTAYTYLAARAFPIPLAAALLTLILADRNRRRARIVQLAIFLITAALVLAPLAYYWATHPASFTTRMRQVAAPGWIEAWAGIRACLAMFFLRGDPYIRFNLPYRPLFDPITGLLFLLGIAVVIWQTLRLLRGANLPGTPQSSPPSARVQLASRIFLITYLPTMLLPSALATSEVTPSNLRSVGLLPFVYAFPALGLSSLQSPLSTLWPSLRRRLPSVVCHLLLVTLLLATLTPITAAAYFERWASSEQLYTAADGDLADVATYLNQADLTDTTPYVASTHYRHPTLAFLAEDYAKIRWLTGGRTIVFPARGDMLLIFPRSASNDLAWARSVLPDNILRAAPPGPDGAPAFHAYRVSEAKGLAPTHPLAANLAHLVRLLGYDLLDEPRSGQTVEVAVWWKVLNAPDQGSYGPVARLADRSGFVWGETQPFHYPSEQWTPGEIVVDHLSIPVGPGAPPGDYVVRFGLYSPGADARLPVLDQAGAYAGTAVELPIHLARAKAPPAPDDLDIRTRLDAQADGLTLLGVNLDTTSARPGERLYLTLFWRANRSPLPDYHVTLSLGDRTLYEGAPVHGTYPTSHWTTGEVVADRCDPRLPLDAPPDTYPLRLRLDDKRFDLGDVNVQAIDRTFEVPPIPHPIAATLSGHGFGELSPALELLGYDLSAGFVTPGKTLTLTLYWRTLTEMKGDYTVFTHLLAPDGSVTSQRDQYPVRGSYPTSLWLPGEVVTDVYEIPIPADAAPGAHQLEVGMYVAETGARLHVEGSANDAIVLQTVTVTE